MQVPAEVLKLLIRFALALQGILMCHYDLHKEPHQLLSLTVPGSKRIKTHD